MFNLLTGGRAHVRNWPGKTIEKQEGTCHYKGVKLKIIDPPGIYGLTANSLDELIARDYIIKGKKRV